MDVLWNNAGAMTLPAASKTAQVVSSFMVSLFAQADHMVCSKALQSSARHQLSGSVHLYSTSAAHLNTEFSLINP